MEQNFWNKVSCEPNSGCWLWEGSLSGGYGMMRWGGRLRHATHVSLDLHGRPRPNAKAMACHHCDMPACVNPDHLYWGTYQTNSDDMEQRGRRVTVRGVSHGMAKLNDELVREIFLSPERNRVIAARLGIRLGAVEDVRARRVWRQVTDALPVRERWHGSTEQRTFLAQLNKVTWPNRPWTTHTCAECGSQWQSQTSYGSYCSNRCWSRGRRRRLRGAQ